MKYCFEKGYRFSKDDKTGMKIQFASENHRSKKAMIESITIEESVLSTTTSSPVMLHGSDGGTTNLDMPFTSSSSNSSSMTASKFVDKERDSTAAISAQGLTPLTTASSTPFTSHFPSINKQ